MVFVKCFFGGIGGGAQKEQKWGLRAVTSFKITHASAASD